LFVRSLSEERLERHCHGQLHMWPTPQSGQSLKFQIIGMLVLYRSEICRWWWKNLRILNLSLCTQKMCSLLPCYTDTQKTMSLILRRPNHTPYAQKTCCWFYDSQNVLPTSFEIDQIHNILRTINVKSATLIFEWNFLFIIFPFWVGICIWGTLWTQSFVISSTKLSSKYKIAEQKSHQFCSIVKFVEQNWTK
jgi:hypothetical protein